MDNQGIATQIDSRTDCCKADKKMQKSSEVFARHEKTAAPVKEKQARTQEGDSRQQQEHALHDATLHDAEEDEKHGKGQEDQKEQNEHLLT